MESIESLKDYILADMIKEVEGMTREQLVRQLIAVKAERIESLSDLKSIIKYGKERKQN